MDVLKSLPNLETAFDGSVDDLIAVTKASPIGTSVAASGDWYNWDSPDYSHFEAYDAVFDAVAAKINAHLGLSATRQQGFDDDTLEPVAVLERNDIFADFFYHWPDHSLFLVFMHEDKELPIEIALIRTA